MKALLLKILKLPSLLLTLKDNLENQGEASASLFIFLFDRPQTADARRLYQGRRPRPVRQADSCK